MSVEVDESANPPMPPESPMADGSTVAASGESIKIADATSDTAMVTHTEQHDLPAVPPPPEPIHDPVPDAESKSEPAPVDVSPDKPNDAPSDVSVDASVDAPVDAPVVAPVVAPVDESPHATVGPVRAVMIAAVLQALVNAAFIASTFRMPVEIAKLRGLHHLYDAGQHLAVGLVAAALVALWVRFGPRRPLWGTLVFAGLALSLSVPILQPDLSPFSYRVVSGRWAPFLLAALTIGGAGAVTFAVVAGQWLGRFRRPIAWIGVLLGIAALIANHRLLRRDYTGTHFFMAFLGTTLIAASISSRRLPQWWARFSAAIPWILVTIISGFTVLVWPGNALLVEMLKIDGSVVAPWAARLRSALRSTAVIPTASRPWFTSRASAPSIPASSPPLLPKNGVVVFVTIDALRADVISSRKHDGRLPTLARLRNTSLDFTMARANGSQTVYSLSALFLGTYFSQQYWVPHPKFPHLYPQDDPTIRFPKFLADTGIPTVTVAPAFWFNNDFGILGGLTEEIYPKDKEVYAHAPYMMNEIVARLEKQGDGPLFLYVHFLDAHAPYDRGGVKGSEFDKYIGEVAYVDHELGRLVETLDRTGLASRTALIVSADHGEAFGEHGATSHATNVYEEQLRVPLLVRMPSIPPRKIDTPVMLIDMGPTVLDLFGVATPGYNMGQSLVPFLRGQKPVLNRPMIVEGRLKKALIMNDGFKVIVDDRAHTSELYNLKTDPGELHNLYDGPDSVGADRIELLRLFFDAHTIKRPGYTVPYRP